MIRALLRIEQHPGEIHLLITDVIMPGMNGHELVQQLMKIRPHLKHLYISGCEGMRGLWSLGQTGHRSCHNAHDNAHANVYSARELWCLHERQRYLQSSKKGWTVNNNRVLLIGWDGADWKVIHRLMDAGKMPNLNRMVNEGVLGDLATLYPPYSPMLWTSIATGKHAFKHGVLGFTEVAPGGGARAVSSYSRHTKALWNIMTGEGAASVTIGWWPSHPVEPVRGVMVSNHFQRVPRGAKDAWQIPPQSVHPASLESHLKPLRWHPTDLRAEHLLNFVPLAAEVNQKQDHRLATLAKLISECSTVYGVAEATLRQVPWQFAGVYFDSIDHFSHGFMQYRPPRLPQVTDADERIYGGVVDAAYCYHDLLLGRLLELVGGDVHVILVSDHGFHSDHLRPVSIPVEPAGPAVQHRTHGIFAMRGPGVKQDERIYGASLLDICPTVLAIMGLPVGRDMDGRPLAQAFAAPLQFDTIESWDTVPGAAGMLLPEAGRSEDPEADREALRQMVELGYIEAMPKNQAQAEKRTRREWSYNLAMSYLGVGRVADALPLLEALVREEPDEFRFGAPYVDALLTLGGLDEAQAALDALREARAKTAAKAQEQFEALRKQVEATPQDKACKPVLQRRRHERLRQLHARANPHAGGGLFLQARIFLVRGLNLDALALLEQLSRQAPEHTGLMVHVGQLLLKLRQWAKAARIFQAVIQRDPNLAAAYLGLCQAQLAARRNLRAADSALSAIALHYDNAFAHYQLGLALQRTRHVERAAEAFRVAVALQPKFPDAYKRLAQICTHRLKDPQAAATYRQLEVDSRAQQAASRARRMPSKHSSSAAAAPTPQSAPDLPPARSIDDRMSRVLVVSGLPRSGTSLLMQMLEAGGVPVWTDGKRGADESNPRGYFEADRVKELARDASWLSDVRGKAIKIVSPMLRFLPVQNVPAVVILMDRAFDEILASQRAMLARLGKAGATVSDERLRNALRTNATAAQQFLARHGVPYRIVRHAACLANPLAVARELNDFLGGGLDVVRMAAVMDSNLYRERQAIR